MLTIACTDDNNNDDDDDAACDVKVQLEPSRPGAGFSFQHSASSFQLLDSSWPAAGHRWRRYSLAIWIGQALETGPVYQQARARANPIAVIRRRVLALETCHSCAARRPLIGANYSPHDGSSWKFDIRTQTVGGARREVVLRNPKIKFLLPRARLSSVCPICGQNWQIGSSPNSGLVSLCRLTQRRGTEKIGLPAPPAPPRPPRWPLARLAGSFAVSPTKKQHQPSKACIIFIDNQISAWLDSYQLDFC